MVELFVPGRLCLFGEHSDWAGALRASTPSLAPGHCLVTGTEQGLRAVAEEAVELFEISTVLPDGTRRGPETFVAEVPDLEAAAAAGGFFGYAAGTAAEVLRRHSAGGLRLEITDADLPIGKGLSSSAAACVVVARAFNWVYALGLSIREEMELAFAGERRAGSACGFMDQVCAFGQATLLLTFDGDDFRIESVRPGGTFHLLVVDLRAAKDTRRILDDLRRCFPNTPGAVAAAVREGLGARSGALVHRARDAVKAGDASALGALMREAQQDFDRLVAPACPELAAPRLHAVLAHPAVAALAYGGKGVGSQGDGTAQLVARGAAERDELAARLARDLGVGCIPLTLAPPAADA